MLTSLFEIARYSGIKPKVVDEFGMEMIDGSYNIWCVEAINNLHQVEIDLNQGLKEGKVSRFTNIFGMRSAKWEGNSVKGMVQKYLHFLLYS